MEVKRNFSLIDLFIVVFLAFRPFYIFLPLSGFFMIHFCFTGKSLLGQLWNFFRDDVIPTTEHSPPLFYSLYLALFAFDWLFLPLTGFFCLWLAFYGLLFFSRKVPLGPALKESNLRPPPRRCFPTIWAITTFSFLKEDF